MMGATTHSVRQASPYKAQRGQEAPPWLESFLEMQAAERGSSANTLTAYKRDLLDLESFLREKRKGIAPRNAKLDDLRSWLESLAKKQMSPATRARKRSAVRRYYAFLTEEGVREDNPTDLLLAGRVARPLPKALSEAETKRLFAAVYAAEGEGAVRLAAILELLYATGLRISELTRLSVSAVAGAVAESPDGDSEETMILVRGKGGRDRLVPIGTKARQATSRWLELRRALLGDTADDNPWLFPSGRDPKEPMSRQRVFQLLRALAPVAGVELRKVSPHALRHAFATHLLAGGADLRVVQELLGHAAISTTQIYTKVTDRRMQEAVSQHHPLAGETELGTGLEKATGKEKSGEMTRGKSPVGKSTVGKSTVGKSATGKSTVGKSATGKSTMGKGATGKKATPVPEATKGEKG